MKDLISKRNGFVPILIHPSLCSDYTHYHLKWHYYYDTRSTTLNPFKRNIFIKTMTWIPSCKPGTKSLRTIQIGELGCKYYNIWLSICEIISYLSVKFIFVLPFILALQNKTRTVGLSHSSVFSPFRNRTLSFCLSFVLE